MSDLMPDMLPDEFTGGEAEQQTEIRYSVRRASRELYARLLAKKRSGAPLNFGEVRKYTKLAQTFGERVPTPELIKLNCGDGYFIVEHMLGNQVFDYSFIIVEPDVRTLSAPLAPTMQPVAQQSDDLDERVMRAVRARACRSFNNCRALR